MPRKKKNGKIDVKAYRFDQSLAKTRRAAHFLDWLARKHPGEFVQYNIVLKAIMGYSRTPRLDSQEVVHLQQSMSRCRLILETEYDRGMITMPSVGVRATYDDDDRAKNELPTKMRRLSSAKQSVERTVNAIDPRKLTDARVKRWLRSDVGGIMKALHQADFDVKALPPAEDD